MNQFCAVCTKAAVQSCSACNSTYYCCKEHQKIHWKTHKISCAPFKTVCDKFGKNLIAIRNIEPGEKILTKLPLLIGPKSDTEIVCMNCYKKLDENFVKCVKCALKFCAKQCVTKTHDDFCKIFQTLDTNPDNLYQFVVPLKILCIKTTDFKKFDGIMSSYSYEPSITQDITQLKILCEKLSLPTNDEELLKIYVISKRNFIDITRGNSNIKGLYPIVPLFKQNCVANTKQIFLEDANQLSIFAKIPIKKGEILSVNFTDPLWGTLDRQIFLKKKFINCSCTRCKDPKELNVYTSSIYCQKCKDKLLEDYSPKIISSNPLEIDADWKCENCPNTIPSKQIAFGHKSLCREIASKNMQQPKTLEHFLFKYGEILHPSNSYSLRVKFKLIQLYGNIDEFQINELPEELLERKIELCHELLDIADVLDPGFSRFRGVLLYELQTTMVVQTKKDYCKELITKAEAEDKLRKSLDILHESCKILLVDPEYKEMLQEKLESLSKMI